MSDTSKRQPRVETPKRGEAAWREARDAIATRNEQARKVGRERRRRQDEEHAAAQRAAELGERAQLAKLRP